MTVAQLLEEYIQLHALHHWSVGTLRENQQRIDDYIVPYIGEQKIKERTTHGLESFYQMLLTVPAVKLKGRKSEDRTVSPYVVAKCHTILRSAESGAALGLFAREQSGDGRRASQEQAGKERRLDGSGSKAGFGLLPESKTPALYVPRAGLFHADRRDTWSDVELCPYRG
ncbi:MAG: hypothetical protein K5855_02485 [Oscillospiraceae bacterium]|nr:hypothetical protein [Oscillospiraceae bacterium]